MGLKKGIIIDLVMLITLGIVGVIYLTLQETKSIQTAKLTPTIAAVATLSPTSTTLANPASINCQQVGGTLVVQKRGDGGEYGLCQFQDNRACEEWALYRKECPVGGMKTTGYDSIDQKYCAWLGGKTFAIPNAKCTLPSGKICADDAVYNGTCQ